MALIDPHSHVDDTQPRTQHVRLELSVDFDRKTIDGTARLDLDRAASGTLDLDTRDLNIESIDGADGFDLSEPDPIKGARLRIHTHAKSVTIRYSTSPSASALQWLAPAQTAGKKLPYVFTQCQAIHARSVFPCQDTPAIRVTYDCRLDVPRETHAVMAAAQVRREENDQRAVEQFEMQQPIPPYLFAFAVGDLVSHDLGPRSRVYAEPSVLEGAAWEFEDVEKMITSAEALFGKYDWERFDLLVMPPSFPYGGMENPRMTFLTPTLLAGDRSLVNVLAHELAHSWTGNLVTNATMNDFWLNEGFTVYAERRILEALEGKDRVALHAAIGLAGLEDEIQRFGPESPLTCLRTNLEGVDPDQAYSQVPYEKGYFFLRRLEDAVGRVRFDEFLKAYITKFRFQSITTDTFLGFLDEALPEAVSEVDIPRWIDKPGLPEDLPRASSDVLAEVEALAQGFESGTRPDSATTDAWGAQEWQIYLDALPRRLATQACAELDEGFQLSTSKNAEIRVGFLTIAAYSGWTAALPAIEKDLTTIGRMKYLKPLYVGLIAAGDESARRAKEIFERARDGYHPVAAAVIEGLFGG